MKKILLSILFAFCFFVSFGQNIINRSTASVTVADARLQATLNLLAPRYADTTAANVNIGIDSCGAQIYTYDVNWYWIRQCSPKRWSLLPTQSGSLISNVFIVDSNHIAICTINGCDTIQVNGIVGPITNITIINNNTLLICGSDQIGSEQITNGGFVGSAANWTVGNLWAYGSNNLTHSFGSTASTFQSGTLTPGTTYVVTIDVEGGTDGTVTVALDGGTSQIYNADAGTVTFNGTWANSISSKISLIPSNDFDGGVTNISVKPLLPNCDTLQILIPSNFNNDSIHILVRTPIHAENDSTFYMTQVGPTISNGDSGWLSPAGYDTFLYKIDTIYHHLGNNRDTLIYGVNGVAYVADIFDKQCNGFGLNSPQAAWTGDTLAIAVTSGDYAINCVEYTNPQTVLVLEDADATNGRFDAIYVDSSGNAGVITGTPSPSPVVPQVDPNFQLFLTSIFIPATATTPPIDSEIIYNENIVPEWIPLTNTGTTTDGNNTLNPYLGVKSVNVTNINTTDIITFTRSSTIDLSAYQALVINIRLKEALSANTFIRATWFNSTSQAGVNFNLTLNKTNVTSYQTVSIPLGNFQLATTVVDNLRLSYVSNDAVVNQGFFLDYIYLQNGITQVLPADQTTIVAYDGLTAFKANGIDSIRVGGTFNQNNTWNTASLYSMSIIGDAPTSTATANLIITNTNGTGRGVQSTANGVSGLALVGNGLSGTAVTGSVTTGTGVNGVATSGVGVQGSVSTGTPGKFVAIPATTNTTVTMLDLQRLTSGTAAANIAGSIQYTLATTIAGQMSNQLVSKWTVATSASRTSQWDLIGVNSAVSATLLSAHGSGVVGIGISSSFAASRLNVVDNGLAGNRMVNFTSNSTTAAGSGQIVLGVTLSGANATASENTWGAYIENTHSGTTSTNTGLQVIATSGTTNVGLAAYTEGLGQAILARNAGAGGGTAVQIVNDGAASGIGVQSVVTNSGAATSTAAWFEASTATANYALLVPSGGGRIGFGTATPSAQALLELASTTQALLIMRMTATQASAITPVNGMIVYVSDTNGTFTSAGFWGYQAGAWAKF